jgi:hypothetical protein
MPARWEPWPGNTTVVVVEASVLRAGIELGTGSYMSEKLTNVKSAPAYESESSLKCNPDLSSYAI